MSLDKKALHKASLDEMLRLVDQTLKELKPKEGGSKLDAALLRWVMTLGILLHNVGKSISCLIETDDAVSIRILGRCIFEYRLKAEFFLKDKETRRLALEQYEVITAGYFRSLERIPKLSPEDAHQVNLARDEWLASGAKTDIYSGKRGVTSMALELALPKDILKDSSGNQYTEELESCYAISSWYVHGSGTLIAAFFPKWNDDTDFEYRMTPMNNEDIYTELHSVIANIYQYVGTVRTRYDLPIYSLKAAGKRANRLLPQALRDFMESAGKRRGDFA